MGENDTSNRDPMLEMFIFETVHLIEQLEELLLDIEKDGCLTPGAVNEIFRIMHTIKGSSAMMEYNEISRLSHSMEDLFDCIRTNRQVPVDCGRLNDHILQGIDFIKAEVAKIENGVESDGQADILIAHVNRFKEAFTSLADSYAAPLTLLNTAPREPVVPSARGMTARSSLKPSHGQLPPNRYAIRIFFEDGCQMENLRAYTVIHNLEAHAVDLAYWPDDIVENEKSSDVIRENGFRIYMTAHATPEAFVPSLEQTMFLERLEVEPVTAFPAGILDGAGEAAAIQNEAAMSDIPSGQNESLAVSQTQASPFLPSGVATDEPISGESEMASPLAQFEGIASAAIAATTKSFPEHALRQIQGKQQSLISVSISKLDQLVDLVGELVISTAMVTKNPDLAGLQMPSFEKAARQLYKITNEIQDIVMSVRMVPIAATFHKMQRLVRDMARKLGKDVTLTLLGEETEVDKSIIDSLADPLMHLIRNALDHGLEDPAERLAADKPSQGTLALEARAAGGDVWITIRDDGRGLDRNRILQKAHERHLLTRPEAEYTEKEIFAFILLPGFSTRDAVSEFSGRGVGMDVVRENIGKVGGSLSLDSVMGGGTTITIRIPLTLAIINGMQIAVGASSYIIPITAIRESFRIDRHQLIIDTEGNEMLMIRGECNRVIRLHRRFEIATDVEDTAKGIMVVVEDDSNTFCLFADRLVGEQQVVVKPLPPYIKKVPGLAGCTILGDGSISLILDISGLSGK